MEYFIKAFELMKRGFRNSLLGIIIILIGSYSLIWLILEPLQIKIQESQLCIYRLFIISASLLITFILSVYILKYLVLQTFSLNLEDDSLDTNLRVTNGNPTKRLVTDIKKKVVLEIVSTFAVDDFYSDLKVNAQYSKKIKYNYERNPDLVLYLRITMLNIQNNTEQKVWMPLRHDIKVVTNGTNNYEKAYPIIPKPYSPNLQKVKINFRKASNKAFKSVGLTYRRIDGFQLTGNGKIAEIKFI